MKKYLVQYVTIRSAEIICDENSLSSEISQTKFTKNEYESITILKEFSDNEGWVVAPKIPN